ncbi:phosphatase PAP2 family protein [Thiocystis violascens]|uniref:undecaprenyl-diphosphate phosphatase n=1 Tax=Thiocystis violascens (strain ATCC 17096 / DSM 198 / 6111) TaxID=765911 RepID=I3Y7G2_THIV6|nr:phosphatase PAP2 family protein [Thiocystis violascens]AFL72930.1 PAP2 superfamily protein [Thiocystis violascens DSM 198]
MTAGLLAFLRRDWHERLLAGTARTPLESPDGARWLARWALVCMIVAATLVLACGYHAGFVRLNAWAAGYPDWIWQCLTVLGDERVPFALSLLFSLRYPRVFWTLVVSAVIAILYSRGLKELVDSARPPGVLAADAFHLIGPGHRHHSFPSGHSVTAGVFFGVLIYHARLIEWRLLFLLLAILAGLSRVAVGVHWPVDVAAGLMGGALAAWLGARLAARWSGPATDVSVHLAIVTLAAVLAIGLLYDDGGYPEAALMLQALGAGALLSALLQYLVLPVLRWRRRG